MTTTELDEVQSLLNRVRPDPTGFAQRLLVQFMTQWGNAPAPDPTTVDAETDDHGASRTIPTTTAAATSLAQVDTNLLLAAALGACPCWGLQSDCETCAGTGGTGWMPPDRELFEELVRPAVVRLAAPSAAEKRTTKGAEG